jgi:serine/threonine-protein kinase
MVSAIATRRELKSPTYSSLVHSGRFSTVYRRLGAGGEELAVKILNPSLSERAHERYLRSCELLRSRVPRSARLPAILATGRSPEGAAWSAMPFLPGTTLQALLDSFSGLFTRPAVLELVRQVACGLGTLHRGGCVHRNVKAANVLVDLGPTGEWSVAILGLGLLRCASEALPDAQAASKSLIVMGTPAYLAPESLRDPRVADERADIYSLGVLLHVLATRRLPFPGRSIIEQLIQKEEGLPPFEEDERLVRLLRCMLHPQPMRRPASMAEVAMRLEEIT